MHGITGTHVEVPVIETERLVMRGYRADDLANALAMRSDPEVNRYIGGVAADTEGAWSRIQRYIGHWAMMGFGYWAVEERGSGEYVGEIGFADFKRELEPSIAGIPEIGWVLAPAMHGRGYATEGVRAALAWGDRHFAAAQTVCLIHPDNGASLRVAEKTGYREIATTTYKGTPTILLAR